jgi:hypothetical protein
LWGCVRIWAQPRFSRVTKLFKKTLYSMNYFMGKMEPQKRGI